MHHHPEVIKIVLPSPSLSLAHLVTGPNEIALVTCLHAWAACKLIQILIQIHALARACTHAMNKEEEVCAGTPEWDDTRQKSVQAMGVHVGYVNYRDDTSLISQRTHRPMWGSLLDYKRGDTGHGRGVASSPPKKTTEFMDELCPCTL